MAGSFPQARNLKAEEAYNIDVKIDDDKPNMGQVMSLKNAALSACADATDGAYAVSSPSLGCFLIFVTGY